MLSSIGQRVSAGACAIFLVPEDGRIQEVAQRLLCFTVGLANPAAAFFVPFQ